MAEDDATSRTAPAKTEARAAAEEGMDTSSSPVQASPSASEPAAGEGAASKAGDKRPEGSRGSDDKEDEGEGASKRRHREGGDRERRRDEDKGRERPPRSSGEGENASSRRDRDAPGREDRDRRDRDGSRGRDEPSRRERDPSRERRRERDDREERGASSRRREGEEDRHRRGSDRDYGPQDSRSRHHRSRSRSGSRRHDSRPRDSRSRSRYDPAPSHRRSRSRSGSRSRRVGDRPAGSGVMDLLQRVIFGGGLLSSGPPPSAATAAAATAAAAALPAAAAAAAVLPPAPAPPALMPGGLSAPVALGADGKPDMTAVLARVQAMSSGGLVLGMPGAAPSGGAASALNKVAREIYVGGLPQNTGLSAIQLRDFFNLVIEKAGLNRAGAAAPPPVTSCRLGDTGAFAFLEMRSPDDTDTVLAHLNGVPLLGTALRLGRPKGYTQQFGNMPAAMAVSQAAAGGFGAGMGMGMGGMGPMGMGGLSGYAGIGAMAAANQGMGGMGGLGLGALGMGAGAGGSGLLPRAAAGPAPAGTGASPAAAAATGENDPTPTDVVLVRNLPSFINAEAVREVMNPFGALTACKAVPPAPGASADAGSALVAYENAALVDTVIGGLNGLDIGGQAMQLSRAPAGLVLAVLGAEFLPEKLRPAPPPPAAAPPPPPTAVLELSNVVVVQDISHISAEELSELREDVSEECGKYGRVLSILIPPLTTAQRAHGQAGASVPVFVQLESPAAAVAVASALRGRKFEGRTVSTRFVEPALLEEMQAAAAVPAPVGAAAEAEGGTGSHFGGASIAPPASYAADPAVDPFALSELPEDGINLPVVPAAADLD